ncbi:hypothetical protein ACFQH6_01325 [Halobacteriaceae archaeon GCM10025711]
MPPGVSDDGTNATALAAAHQDALAGQSYTVSLDTDLDSAAGNRTLHFEAQTNAAGDRVVLSQRSAGGGQSMSLDVFAANGTAAVRQTAGNRSTVSTGLEQSQTPANRLRSGAGADVHRLVAIANFTPTGVRTVDGEPLVVLEADGDDVAGTFAESNVSSFNGTVLVDEQGLVHSLSIDVRGSQGSALDSASFSLSYSDVGETTVKRPSWVEQAEEANATQS